MNTGRNLHQILDRLVRSKAHSEIITPQHGFTWPQDLLPFGHCFKGYTWALSLSQRISRVFGICALGSRPPYSLWQVESAIFEPDADQNTWYTLHSADLEYYRIIEMFNAEFARATLAVLSRTTGWHTLDEHILRRPQPVPVPIYFQPEAS
jgi:hypothetical protein